MVTNPDPEQVYELQMLRREYEASFRRATEPSEKLRLARMLDDLSSCLHALQERTLASH